MLDLLEQIKSMKYINKKKLIGLVYMNNNDNPILINCQFLKIVIYAYTLYNECLNTKEFSMVYWGSLVSKQFTHSEASHIIFVVRLSESQKGRSSHNNHLIIVRREISVYKALKYKQVQPSLSIIILPATPMIRML